MHPQPQVQTYSKSRAITTIPWLLSNPSQTPAWWLPNQKFQLLRSAWLLVLGDADRISGRRQSTVCWYVQLSLSISPTVGLNMSVNQGPHGLNRTPLCKGLLQPLIFLGDFKPSAEGLQLGWGTRKRKGFIVISCLGDVSQNTQKPKAR